VTTPPPDEASDCPVPTGCGSVLLFGGTFDPPHAAHAELALRARDHAFPAGSNAWLVLIPAARNPHKPGGPSASGQHRAAMLRLAFDAAPRCAVWTEELRRAERTGEPSYFIDTLRAARRTLVPGADLRFLLGADQVAAFHRWREAGAILDLARPVVLLREPWRTPTDLERELRNTGAWTDDELGDWLGAIAPVGVLDARATDARAGQALDRLAPAVRAYIREHGLYR